MVKGFVEDWSRAALPLGLVLLLLSPFMFEGLGLAGFLVFLQLPVFMLHQYEENSHNRFYDFVNQLLGGGREVLSLRAIFWINVLGVWVVDLALLYLATYVNPALGLMAGYLTVVNAALHIGLALALGLNPGVWTSVLLFLPAGGYCVYFLSIALPATLTDHLIGLGAALLLHVSIVQLVRQKAARLKEAG